MFYFNPFILHLLFALIAISFCFPKVYEINHKLKLLIWIFSFIIISINYHYLYDFNSIYEYKGVLRNIHPSAIQFFQYEHIREAYLNGHCLSSIYLSDDIQVTDKIEHVDPQNVITYSADGSFDALESYNNPILRCLNHRYIFEFLFFLPLAFLHWASGSFYFAICLFNIVIVYSLLYIFLIIENNFSQKITQNQYIVDKIKPNFVWFYFYIFCFFGFTYQLGFHYRTMLATSIACLSTFLIWSNKKKTGWIFLFLSIFVHNGMIIFFPLIFAFMKHRLRVVFGLISIVLISILIYFLMNFSILKATKSNFYIGEIIDELYIISFLSVTTIMVLINFFKNRQIFDVYTTIVLLSSFTLVCMYPIFESGSIERIALVLSLVITLFAAIWIEKYPVFNPIAQRVIVILISILPLSHYYSSLLLKPIVLY